MRRVLVEVSGEYLLSWLTLGNIVCPGEAQIVEGLPGDARLVGAHYDPRGTVILAFEHESFPDIPEGHVLSTLDIVMESRHLGTLPCEDVEAPDFVEHQTNELASRKPT